MYKTLSILFATVFLLAGHVKYGHVSSKGFVELTKQLFDGSLKNATVESFEDFEQTMEPLVGSENIQKECLPNIVFILADDMGVAQLGCYGSEYYQTPNIDKLAREGMLFTNAYAAAAVCSPTRASIMTGKYPARLKLTDYIPGTVKKSEILKIPQWQAYLPLSELTFAEVLAEGGYKTALFGKWHLSIDKRPPKSLEHNPDRQGFQEAFITYKPSGDNLAVWQVSEMDAHNIDTITNRGIDFMQGHKNKPFLLMLSHNAIHDPLMSKHKLVKKYKDHPQNDLPENHPVIGAMVECLDNSVGRIVEALDELRIADNTIVIFFSDNGGKHSYAVQKPFRSGKGWLYEGGIRVPLIVKWPGKSESGSISNEMVSSIDFFPTIIEMAKLKLNQPKGMDGLNLVPVLQGGQINREVLCWHYPHYHYGSGMKPASAIRYGDYKLIEWYENELTGKTSFVELYNLKDDVGEQNNLADTNQDLTKRMLKKLNQWKKEVGAQLPSLN